MNQVYDLSKARERESSFIAQVYRWMAGGLLMSTLSAFVVLSSPAVMTALFKNPVLMIGLFVAQIGLVLWLSARVQSMSFGKAAAIFSVYSALNGVALSPIVLIYTGASLVSTFAITAGTFMLFSVYGSVTKKDLTSIGSLAMMGLLGFMIASLVNLFLKSPAMYWIVTYGLIAVFLGLIAYDTQRLKVLCQMGFDSRESQSKTALLGALTLYLDFINLFLLLLRIFGNQRRN